MTDSVVSTCALLASALILLPITVANTRTNSLSMQILCENKTSPSTCSPLAGQSSVELQYAIQLLMAAVGCALIAALLKLNHKDALYVIVPLFVAALGVYLQNPLNDQESTSLFRDNKLWTLIVLSVTSSLAVYFVHQRQILITVALWVLIWIALYTTFINHPGGFDECVTLSFLSAAYILTESETSQTLITTAILTISSFYMFVRSVQTKQDNAL